MRGGIAPDFACAGHDPDPAFDLAIIKRSKTMNIRNSSTLADRFEPLRPSDWRLVGGGDGGCYQPPQTQPVDHPGDLLPPIFTDITVWY